MNRFSEKVMLKKTTARDDVSPKSHPAPGDAPLVQAFPLALQAYRLLTAAAAPLAPALISHRLKRRKEHPSRLRERYGQTELSRPAG